MSDIISSFTDPIGSIIGGGNPKKVFGTLLDPLGLGINKSGGSGLDLAKLVQGPAPETPATLIDPTTLPSLTSSDSRAAKRKAAATQLARKGRASTILTNPDSLGPGPG